jgi:hypothetical protein
VCIHVAGGAAAVSVTTGPPLNAGETGITKLCGVCEDLLKRVGHEFPDDIMLSVCQQCLEESQRGVG